MATDTFDILFLIARPAAGKSEIIDYLKRTPEPERRARFHAGELAELDDFPLIWTWFEEDRLLVQSGHPRLHTDADEHFLYPYFWDLLIERLSLNYARLLRDQPDFHAGGGTVLMEFARGVQHGGFRQAFAHVPPEMLRRGAILYVKVSWEESLRKNRARRNPAKPDSILEHSLPDANLAFLYQESDWNAFSAADPAYITIQDVCVPYAVFENEDDVTTPRGEALGRRLEETLARLWVRSAVR
ncbi:MAG: hypothetical protein NT169_17890 [Chloroflexi bacterium]|nr:hypothetical protein [Chloroflexota bacterium]